VPRELRRLIRNLKANGCDEMDKEGPVIPAGIPAKFLNCTELPPLHRGTDAIAKQLLLNPCQQCFSRQISYDLVNVE
jgi:hypothetical protein